MGGPGHGVRAGDMGCAPGTWGARFPSVDGCVGGGNLHGANASRGTWPSEAATPPLAVLPTAPGQPHDLLHSVRVFHAYTLPRSEGSGPQWLSDARPLSMRRSTTWTPPGVLSRRIHPCLRLRLMLLGWYSFPRALPRTCSGAGSPSHSRGWSHLWGRRDGEESQRGAPCNLGAAPSLF